MSSIMVLDGCPAWLAWVAEARRSRFGSHLHVLLPNELKEELEEAAKERGADLSDVVRDALSEWLERNRSRKEPETGERMCE